MEWKNIYGINLVKGGKWDNVGPDIDHDNRE